MIVNYWEEVNVILDFAIKNEEEAAQFYTDLAKTMDSPAMRKVFEDFAREEQGHKAKLMGVKQEGGMEAPVGDVPDLKVGDYLVDVSPTPKMSYQDVLILAMKQEKAAFKLYSALAAKTNDDEVRKLFLMLAQEEAKHKLRFEIEYDDEILREN